MSEQKQHSVGDQIVINDLAKTPEGSWVVKETMQFLRAQAGHSIVSITPIENGKPAVDRLSDRFTIVYAGDYQAPKSSAIATALNSL
ncbi:MAG: hypothetical protein EPO24_14905 [Bacteroidetes bacterium]|nr:MAG: hypothetical protein EPO24_14905 [Bacteroidota bacterium]